MTNKTITHKKNSFHLAHGDYSKIATLTGFSYTYVRRVLKIGDKSNKQILNAAQKISDFNQNLKENAKQAPTRKRIPLGQNS